MPGLIWRGNWSPGTNYGVRDAVTTDTAGTASHVLAGELCGTGMTETV
jgi:hypothetical protein